MSIPNEAVEAAARADWESYVASRAGAPFDYPPFGELPAYIQDRYRTDVLPMLIAAAPFLGART